MTFDEWYRKNYTKDGVILANAFTERMEAAMRTGWDAAVEHSRAEAARSVWIDAEERLPERETDTCSVDAIFLDAHGDAFVGYAYLDENYKGRAWCRASRANKYITHWMPLSEQLPLRGTSARNIEEAK